MRTLDFQAGQRPRYGKNGTYWVHFPCPFCTRRGWAPDDSCHLGVGITLVRSVKLHCWRCGFGADLSKMKDLHVKGLPSSIVSKRATRKEEMRDLQKREWRSLSEVDPDCVFLSHLVRSFEEHGVWKGLTIHELRECGLRVEIGKTDRVACPYRHIDGGLGIQIRRFGKDPKVLTEGPAGPSTFLGRTLVHGGSPIVIVEGWADAAGIPSSFQSVFILGTGNAELAVPLLNDRSEFVLALDGDDAGRRAMKTLALRGIEAGANVTVAVLPTGSDPADLGRARMREVLAQRQAVSNLRELQAVLARCRA